MKMSVYKNRHTAITWLPALKDQDLRCKLHVVTSNWRFMDNLPRDVKKTVTACKTASLFKPLGLKERVQLCIISTKMKEYINAVQ